MTDRQLLWVALAGLAGALLTTPTVFLGDVVAGAVVCAAIVAVVVFVRRRA